MKFNSAQEEAQAAYEPLTILAEKHPLKVDAFVADWHDLTNGQNVNRRNCARFLVGRKAGTTWIQWPDDFKKFTVEYFGIEGHNLDDRFNSCFTPEGLHFQKVQFIAQRERSRASQRVKRGPQMVQRVTKALFVALKSAEAHGMTIDLLNGEFKVTFKAHTVKGREYEACLVVGLNGARKCDNGTINIEGGRDQSRAELPD